MESSYYPMFFLRIVVLVFCSTLPLLSSHSYAQVFKELESPRKQIIYFDLPSQTLKNGLIEFAIQSKLNIVVASELVDGFRSKPIIGPHTPERALELLISKAPLTFTVIEDSQAIVIQSASHMAATHPDNTRQRNQAQGDKLQEIITNGTHFPFRYNTVSNSQIYGNTAAFSSARFINSLPNTLVNDQVPDELTDLLKLSSGITPSDGLADTNDDFYIRGFPRYGVYVDGFLLSSDTGTKLSMANVERIEVLKGPSTLFYGQAEPGGIVNVIRKKPKRQSKKKLTLSSGSHNEKQAHLDFTGPLTSPTSSLLYRLIISQKKQDSFRDLNDIEVDLLAPSLTWEASQKTTLALSYEQQRSKQTREQGAVILAPLREGVDIVSIDGPAHKARPNFLAHKELATAELLHHFDSNWALQASFFQSSELRKGIRGNRDALYTSNFLLDKEDLDPSGITVVGGIVLGGNTDVTKRAQWLPVATIRSLFDERGNERTKALRIIVNGDYLIGSTHNELSTGLTWGKKNQLDEYWLEQRSDIRSLSLAETDLEGSDIQEAVDAVFDETPNIGKLTKKQQSLNHTDYGVFLLNNTQLNDSWRLSLGGRYTRANGQRIITNESTQSTLKTYRQLSSELGVHYQPTEAAALYFNYSEGFKANYQADDLNTLVNKPELSQQVELGLKTLLFEDSLAGTLALFKIDKTNVVDIRFVEGVRVASLHGRQSSTGIDMDLSYQHSNNLNVIAALSFINPVIETGDNSGNMPELASKKTASGFLNYSFPKGWAKGLSVNIGGYYLGQRYGNNDNNSYSRIKPFSTIDLGSSYKVGAYQFRLSVKNALDKKYLLATEGRIRSNHGSERRIIVSVSAAF